MNKGISLSLFEFLSSCAKKQTNPVMHTVKNATATPLPKMGLLMGCANPASKAQRAHSVHPLRWLVGEIPKPLGTKPFRFCT